LTRDPLTHCPISSSVVHNPRRHYKLFNHKIIRLYYYTLTWTSHEVKRQSYDKQSCWLQGGPKSKPQPNDQKIVLNRIKACLWN